MSRFEDFAVSCWRRADIGLLDWDDVCGYMIACIAVLEYPESDDARTLYDIAETIKYGRQAGDLL